MSSVHSQNSDLGPDEVGLKVNKPTGSGMGTATRTSSNNSNKSTMTFEKQRVAPRTRTQSVQSVLSCISLRSMIGKTHEEAAESHQQQYPQHNNKLSVSGLPATQLIQSPAMASVQKRASNSNNDDAIGQKLPFTDDKRRQLEVDQQRSSSRASNKVTTGSALTGMKLNIRDKMGSMSSDSHGGSDKNSEDNLEDEAEQQKRLTTDALRRLSSMKSSNGDIEGGATENSSEGPRTLPERQLLPSANSSSTPTFRESYCEEPDTLTQIQFGGKNIIMDSSIANKRASVAPIKHPLDVLPSAFDTSARPRTKSKRPLRQMNASKKPLYTPAVLRDISETNITSAELGSPGPSFLPFQNSGTHTTRSSVRSVRSTSSSIMSDYTKKLSSLWNKNPSDSKATEVPPPTRQHWISDGKRNSCHYCHRIFTFWERKHHCRHCGDIFCSQHVRHWLYLDRDAKFVIGGAGVGSLSKICDGCLQEYDTLVREGPSVETTNQNNDTPKSVTPVPGVHVALDRKNLVEEEGKRGRMDSIVGSVPADWNWSSF
ncbi:LANO_0F07690g1_1 [Lachancea nothofagi CBS 11611]|uniref:LANO_0F07690g1_1 n=1 Tax=Lachancea nothofagi CBS 11611 TaxID=1266666 RepID=A0A1G4K969_9SACH|nr:LANO_0F07690g1_1 [Lachancea nothofagi CBS 11611]